MQHVCLPFSHGALFAKAVKALPQVLVVELCDAGLLRAYPRAKP